MVNPMRVLGFYASANRNTSARVVKDSVRVNALILTYQVSIGN